MLNSRPAEQTRRDVVLSSLTHSLSSPSFYFSFRPLFYTGVSLSLINLALSSQVNFPCYAAATLLSSFTVSSRRVRILATVYQEEDIILYGNTRQCKPHCGFHPSCRIVCILQFWIPPMPSAQQQGFFLRLCTHRTFT